MPTIPGLYDIFSANLSLYKEGYNDHFMCPLCLHTFSRDEIQSDLSKAHIIPQFQGGKDWTLTCRKCNNKVGSEIESYEAERIKYHRALSGNGDETITARIDVGNDEDVIGPVQTDMRIKLCDSDSRLQLFLQQRGSRPEAYKQFNEQLNNGTSISAKVTYDIPSNSKRANLTYVHAAYLCMFHQFGYEWIFSPGAELIRKQIMSPDEEIIIPLFPALYGHHIPDEELRILIVTKPSAFRSFIVVMPLIDCYTKRQGVWMPLFGYLNKQPPKLTNVELQFKDVPGYHQFLDQSGSFKQGSRFVHESINLWER